ncbi:unnamed protein product, partial [Prorocentrum cordatum]
SRYAGLPRAAASPSPPAPGGRRGARERRRMFAPQGHDPAHLPCAGFSTAGYPMGYNPMQTGMQTGMPGTAATTYYGAQPGGHVPATQPVYSSHHREEDYDQTFPQPMGTQMRMQQAADKRMRDSFQSNQSGCVGMNQLLLHQHKQRHRGTDPPRRPPVADTAVVGWLLRAPRGTGASHVLAEDHERWPVLDVRISELRHLVDQHLAHHGEPAAPPLGEPLCASASLRRERDTQDTIHRLRPQLPSPAAPERHRCGKARPPVGIRSDVELRGEDPSETSAV